MTLFLAGVSFVQLAAATRVDATIFAVAALMILVGAVGVVVSRNPVHSALMLVLTLFGVAVLFVEQQANFLAAVQVIVYAGAIVVLFLFVIMFLGVDREENVAVDPLPAQRPLAVGLVALGLAGVLILGFAGHWSTGARSVAGQARGQTGGDVAALGRSVFTTYLFPFEITAALLVIAVVGAVVLARRPPRARRAGTEPIALPTDVAPKPVEPGAPVADPMVALAEAVAQAVSAGLVATELGGVAPEGDGENEPQRKEEPVGEGGR